jgi:2-polyprenyl-6-methoxyphenol hydroxylase-like FAD-dependent oxidoreductase
MTVLVVGGGVGGLAAAVALRRAGADVVVLERARAAEEAGTALALGVNAVASLRSLGLADAVLAASAPLEAAEIRDAKGAVLCRADLTPLARRRGVPAVCIARADLLAILLAAAGGGTVRFGAECAEIRDDADGAVVRLGDGTEVRGAAVVGADGIRSVVRRSLGDESAPRAAGYAAWRAVVAFHVPPGVGVECWGRGLRFGFAALPRGRTYWYAARNAAPGAPETRARKDELRAAFAAWPAPIPQLVEAADEAILRHDIFDRPPSHAWGRGRVTLLGDAAHAMTPDLGQGACQAIEDAVVLARHLGAKVDVPASLRAYERERTARTSAMVRESRRLGRVAQWEGRAACALRDAALRWTPAWAVRRNLERTQGWTP